MTDFVRAEKAGFAREAKEKVNTNRARNNADLVQIDSKYNPELAAQVLEWIASVTGEQLDTSGDRDSFVEQLKDGRVLCSFANGLKPGTIKKINSSTLAFKQMENIGFFLNFLETEAEIPKHELFQTVDLYDGQDPNSVTVALASLARKSERVFGKPGFGPPERERQAARKWTDEEVKRASESVIGMQMGYNKGASQAGMTSPGTYRHM